MLLADLAIDAEGVLVLRRVLASDGRSRAFVNDEPVTGQLLRRLGDLLVEVHGQNEQRGLLSASLHREFLDAFASLQEETAGVAQAFTAWRAALEELHAQRVALDAARREEDDLRHVAHELETLAPEPGEEDALAERRQFLMNREKLASAVTEALAAVTATGGARERLLQAERRLDRVRALAGDRLDASAAALTRALVEIDEAEAAMEATARDLEQGSADLDLVEERLFALRDVARKHRVTVDALPALLERIRNDLTALDRGADALASAERGVDLARRRYIELATQLGDGRRAAADRLARAVTAELAPLRLERARFRVDVEMLAEDEWGSFGRDRVAFAVSTNPGQPFGPLARIASGGELSRLMLALKVVLARVGVAGTLVFDEVDAGVGGATADAVGERLARLARERQVLVVTHAAQIAARADHHLQVEKRIGRGDTTVSVRALAPAERQLEIARMLAGAEVTEAARAAARSLLERAMDRPKAGAA
jgi:DNA repair protein RecN (Recombination protein N)